MKEGSELYVTDLPRFVQKRGYEKGALIARIVVVGQGEGDGWLYSRPLIEGTRLDARDIAKAAVRYGPDNVTVLADEYRITVEQVEAAVVWTKAHPRWRPRKRKPEPWEPFA